MDGPTYVVEVNRYVEPAYNGVYVVHELERRQDDEAGNPIVLASWVERIYQPY